MHSSACCSGKLERLYGDCRASSICGMSSPPISPEQLAAFLPDVRAVIEAIVRHDEERIARLEAELPGSAEGAQNSSVPPARSIRMPGR